MKPYPLLLAVLMVAACRPAASTLSNVTPSVGVSEEASTPLTPDATTAVSDLDVSPSPTIEVNDTGTVTSPPSACAGAEETRPLPEAGERIRAALVDAGSPITAVDALATGVPCGSDSFDVHKLDLTFHIAMGAPFDSDDQGNLLAAILTTLDTLPADQVPHWQQGNLTLSFEWTGNTSTVTFPPETIKHKQAKIVQGVTGAALWIEPQPQCYFNWATHPLPDVTTQVQAALNSAGITNATASAEAFGEDCINPDGTVQGFATMETDYTVRITTADVQDRETMGNEAVAVLQVLMGFPTGSTPGPQPGRIILIFVAGDQTFYLTMSYEDAQQALADGLMGAVLIDKLQNNP